jgi:hypothetical protein
MADHISWAAFATKAPTVAGEGRRLLALGDGGDTGPAADTGHAFLVTVRGADIPPRIHPVTVGFVGDGLYTFVLRSPKRTDLEEDGRYAVHAMLNPDVPGEFSVRGRARRVDDPAIRAAAVAAWPFEADESYDLFEFSIETALLGERRSPDEWPPRYTSWAA